MLTPEQIIELQKAEKALAKAKVKSMEKHFKKAASHHAGNAEDDEKCEAAHKAHAEVHEKKMGKAEDPDHEVHKASAAFHKSLAKFAATMGKREKEYGEHCMKMANACADTDAKKILKAAEFTDDEITTLLKDEAVVETREETTMEKKEAAAPAVSEVKDPPTVDPAAPVVAATANESLDKAVGDQLNKAMELSFKRILESAEFGKKMDEMIAQKMIEKLGGTTQPTTVKTFNVERTNGSGVITSPSSVLKVDNTGVAPEFAHLLVTEDTN